MTRAREIAGLRAQGVPPAGGDGEVAGASGGNPAGGSGGSAASSRAEDNVGTRAGALFSAARSGCAVGDGTAAPFDDAAVTGSASALGDVGACASASAPASARTGASVFGSGRSINVSATAAPTSSFAATPLGRVHLVSVFCVLPDAR